MKRKGSSMPRYVKNESEYSKVSFQATKIRAALKRARGVPYQMLMPMFIVEGLKRLKRAG
jgi:hypothetical protein